MDNEALFESIMLDEADHALLDADLAKIAAMIERAAAAIDGAAARPATPDAAWQRIVPEADPAGQPEGAEQADVVNARHEIAPSGITVPAGVLNVPRVVG